MTNDRQPKAKRLVASLLIGLGLVIAGGVTMDHHSTTIGTFSGSGRGGSWNPHNVGK